MATGETVDAEALGGARIHASATGLTDQIATDEFDALRKAREWISSLPSTPIPRALSAPLKPRYPTEDLLALLNPDIRKVFDMTEVLLRIVDDSRLSIYKPTHGANMVTAWATVQGHLVVIIASQVPVINPDEASKGTQFIRLCNQQNTPIIFLHNVTGFMVGTKAEHAAIIKCGAQLVSAVSCSQVPHISIILGASYGAGNYAMCGRSYAPRFLFSWPIGRCSVMGPEQLAGVMQSVQANSAKARGVVRSIEEVEKSTQKFHDEVSRDSESYRTSAALMDETLGTPEMSLGCVSTWSAAQALEEPLRIEHWPGCSNWYASCGYSISTFVVGNKVGNCQFHEDDRGGCATTLTSIY
ncbi:hypothetical protein LTR37_001666 [Vermiconidia calcicola]|uniref:Uncharacterized protein n=1 Tax=Vermiconidia calcicola TaxID=1690605 RepID=A0ACC3NW60_9PEZI|nr:hypothetical protein LTR37_001666 [Vermiconidia calcicola]